MTLGCRSPPSAGPRQPLAGRLAREQARLAEVTAKVGSSNRDDSDIRRAADLRPAATRTGALTLFLYVDFYYARTQDCYQFE